MPPSRCCRQPQHPELARAWDIDLSRTAVNMYKDVRADADRRHPWNRGVAGWWFNDSLKSKKYWYGEPWAGSTAKSPGRCTSATWKSTCGDRALAQDPKASIIGALGASKTREQQVPIIDGWLTTSRASSR